MGETQPDSGKVFLDRSLRINYLPQIIGDDYVQKCLTRLSEGYSDEALDHGSYSEVMTSLDLWDIVSMETPVLSGGQKTKVALACALVFSADLIILDEPTNYLDLKSVLWLEGFLGRSTSAILTVSHDRAYLDNVVEGTLALTKKGVRYYSGGYSDFVEAAEHETERHYEMYQAQQGTRERLEADIRRTKDQASRTENSTRNDVLRRYAKKVAKKAKSRERRLTKMLLSEDWVGKPHERPSVYVSFDTVFRKGTLVRTEDLAFSYEGATTPTLVSGSIVVSAGEKVAVLGDNGSGKTTLLRLIVGELVPDSGKLWRNESAIVGYFAQNLMDLDPNATVIEAVRHGLAVKEEEARHVLGGLLIQQDQVYQKVNTLSQGERTKVGIARQILKKPDLLVLDEFTAHLDLDAIEQIQEAVSEYKGAVLFVTHDRYLLESIKIDRFYCISGGTSKELLGGLQEYESMVS